jgi:diacylglycerol kinase (ATP)
MVALTVVAHERKLGRKRREKLQAALVEAGLGDVPWRGVGKARKAEQAAREAVADGAEVVLVCGGDGTVRAGAAGVVDTGAALAVLPAGTANLFATALELPSDPVEIVGAITAGTRRVIDTGVCNDQTFTVMAGTGFDAAMVDDADAGKDRLGVAAYFRAAVGNARHRQPVPMTVTVDGETFFEGEATCVLVGNLGTLTGGLEAFPDASPTDGVLDVAVITATGLRDWAHVLWRMVRHQQHRSGHAHMTQGGEIAVDMKGKHRMELDGGAKGTTDALHITVRPQSLRLCVPATP